jgi:hypothetical protein
LRARDNARSALRISWPGSSPSSGTRVMPMLALTSISNVLPTAMASRCRLWISRSANTEASSVVVMLGIRSANSTPVRRATAASGPAIEVKRSATPRNSALPSA